MGFFKSLKGDLPDKVGGSTSYNESSSSPSSDIRKHPYSQASEETFAPPPGPPPSHREQFAPPAGPPPSHREEYAPPSGPPPSHRDPAPATPSSHREEYAPPPGPPPSHQQKGDVPAYHDWTVIPDTALLPPPPSLGHQASSVSNANRSDADRAHDWCRVNPLYPPRLPNNAEYSSVKNGDLRLITPREFKGSLTMMSSGAWKGRTRAASTDSCLLSNLPLYFAEMDSPLRTETTKTIYFEVKIVSFGGGGGTDASSLALGFCALPYPIWRMPGWERGSLAVHSDDGRRYVNDTWGGKDFTSPIKVGQTVGIGMTFSIPNSPPAYDATPTGSSAVVGVFFTRDGRKDGGWDLHEELDATNDLGVDGLEGNFDLYGAVGIFGGAEFEVSFNSRDWLWQPR